SCSYVGSFNVLVRRRRPTIRCTVAAPASLSSTLSGFFLVACNRAWHGELNRWALASFWPMRIMRTLLFAFLSLPLLPACNALRMTPPASQTRDSWEVAIEQPFEMARPFSEGLAVIVKSGKYGYIDKAGKVVVEPQFDEASDFSDGTAEVTINYKHGYINHDGQIIIKPQFEYAYPFS